MKLLNKSFKIIFKSYLSITLFYKNQRYYIHFSNNDEIGTFMDFIHLPTICFFIEIIINNNYVILIDYFE